MTRAGVAPTAAGISAALTAWVAHRPVTDAAAAAAGIAVLDWADAGRTAVGWRVVVRRGDAGAAVDPVAGRGRRRRCTAPAPPRRTAPTTSSSTSGSRGRWRCGRTRTCRARHRRARRARAHARADRGGRPADQPTCTWSSRRTGRSPAPAPGSPPGSRGRPPRPASRCPGRTSPTCPGSEPPPRLARPGAGPGTGGIRRCSRTPSARARASRAPGAPSPGCTKPNRPALAVIQVHCGEPATLMPPHRSTASAHPWLDVPGTAASAGLRVERRRPGGVGPVGVGDAQRRPERRLEAALIARRTPRRRSAARGRPRPAGTAPRPGSGRCRSRPRPG